MQAKAKTITVTADKDAEYERINAKRSERIAFKDDYKTLKAEYEKLVKDNKIKLSAENAADAAAKKLKEEKKENDSKYKAAKKEFESA
jgi:hypothetical protein